MNDVAKPRIISRAATEPVILPDGSQPLPLGSGYISALIGSGAMSNVYRIWNPQLETMRAVKLMKPDISPESRQRFQTEMKIMAALSHPNIIEIHSVGEWNSLSYIEMEIIDGYTLSEIIEKKGALPVHLCTALGIMISRALVYAHNKDYVLFGKSYHGIIHRDLKPSNLMVSKEGSVKLMDFGIARPVESSLMTMDGAVMGTMQYLAPEQIDGKNVGVAADIYALGSVLYEALTGRKAFPQKNLSMLMAAKTSNSFIPLKLFRFNIPPALRDIIGKCMAFDPKKRPASAEMALEHLRRIHHRLTRDAPENILHAFLGAPLTQRRELAVRKPVPLKPVGALSGFLAVAALTCIFFARPHKTAEPLSIPVMVQPAAARADSISKDSESVKNAARRPEQAPVRKRITRSPVGENGKKVQTASVRNPSATPSNNPVLGIGEALESMTREAEAGRYETVVRTFNRLPAEIAGNQSIRLLRMRALFALGKRAEIEATGDRLIDDGEYYLIRAKLVYSEGDAGKALRLLEKSAEVRARLLDAETARRDYLFYRALCLGRIFDRQATPENRANALDAWFEVKTYLRKSPEHAYFQKAVAEMQRIGETPRHGNG